VLLQGRRFGQLFESRRIGRGLDPAAIAALDGLHVQQRVEAVNGQAVGRALGPFFSLDGGRSFGGRDGIADAPQFGQFLICEQQRSPGAAHVPFDVVGHPAQGFDLLGRPMREIGDGAFSDLAVLAPRFAQQDGRRGITIGGLFRCTW